MVERKSRGAFVVIEGLDRSGKSTQSALLLERLQSAGVQVKLIKFPDRTTAIGKMIDSYLRSETDLDDHAIHLLFSANRWELASSIEETLKAGTTVLCDRYAFSGMAFSAAKNKPDLSYEWCRAPDVSLPAPDITLFLDVSPEKAKERGGYGDERYEKEDVQERVRDVFERIGIEMGEGSKWIVVDADLPKEEVAEVMWRHIEPLSKGVNHTIQRLWDDHENRHKNSHLYI